MRRAWGFGAPGKARTMGGWGRSPVPLRGLFGRNAGRQGADLAPMRHRRRLAPAPPAKAPAAAGREWPGARRSKTRANRRGPLAGARKGLARRAEAQFRNAHRTRPPCREAPPRRALPRRPGPGSGSPRRRGALRAKAPACVGRPDGGDHGLTPVALLMAQAGGAIRPLFPPGDPEVVLLVLLADCASGSVLFCDSRWAAVTGGSEVGRNHRRDPFERPVPTKRDEGAPRSFARQGRRRTGDAGARPPIGKPRAKEARGAEADSAKRRDEVSWRSAGHLGGRPGRRNPGPNRRGAWTARLPPCRRRAALSRKRSIYARTASGPAPAGTASSGPWAASMIS